METRRTTLRNKLRIVTTNIPDAFSATVAIAVGVGSRFETSRIAGLSHLVEHLLYREILQSQVEDLGGQVQAYTDIDSTQYQIKTPGEHLSYTLDVLCEVVGGPSFDPVAADKERGAVIEEMRWRENNAERHAYMAVLKLLFPSHEISQPVLGSKKVVENVSIATIRAFHREHYVAPNMVVTVAGAVDHDVIVEQIRQRLGGLPVRELPQPPPAVACPSQQLVKTHIMDVVQAQLIVGMRFDNNDVAALEVLSSILNSRLWASVRTERGLAYDVGTDEVVLADAGALEVHVGSGVEHAHQALELIVEEIRNPSTITKAEVAIAKKKLIAQNGYHFESGELIATKQGCDLAVFGATGSRRKMEVRTRSVTLAEVQQVADEVLHPENFRLAIVAPRATTTRLSRLFRTLVRL